MLTTSIYLSSNYKLKQWNFPWNFNQKSKKIGFLTETLTQPVRSKCSNLEKNGAKLESPFPFKLVFPAKFNDWTGKYFTKLNNASLEYRLEYANDSECKYLHWSVNESNTSSVTPFAELFI